jgi:hypothetical protein
MKWIELQAYVMKTLWWAELIVSKCTLFEYFESLKLIESSNIN